MAGASSERGRESCAIGRLRREPSRLPVSTIYNGEVDRRVEEVGAVHRQDLYVCKLGLEDLDAPGGQYVYAAMVDGSLYTHATNPNLISARVLDPSF